MNKDFEWQVPSHYSDPYFNLSVYKAAPKMYEALQSWGELYSMRPLDSGDDMQKILERCWDKTERALAKAEGK